MGYANGTGTVFANKATSNIVDDKLQGVQYTGDFGGMKVILAKAADDTLTIKMGDDYRMLPPMTNNFGCFWIEEINGTRYFLSERTNAKGKYLIAKIAKPKADAGSEPAAPVAPKTYGKRQA
jgi:hypothetical protein